jgi:hypothetical protein
MQYQQQHSLQGDPRYEASIGLAERREAERREMERREVERREAERMRESERDLWLQKTLADARRR